MYIKVFYSVSQSSFVSCVCVLVLHNEVDKSAVTVTHCETKTVPGIKGLCTVCFYMSGRTEKNQICGTFK